uniref:Uncharacterized protein n=1 Tax=Oryza punctata TaxID=4537 RepID=A0A0E0M785_ORYPU
MKLTHVDAKGNYTGEELVRRAITVGKQRLAFLDATMASGGGGVAVATWACPSTGRRCSTSPSTSSATRGDLVWTQCSTCLRKICAKQTLSYYNSSASSSFAWCRAAKSAANDIHFCDLGGGCSFIASSSCVSPGTEPPTADNTAARTGAARTGGGRQGGSGAHRSDAHRQRRARRQRRRGTHSTGTLRRRGAHGSGAHRRWRCRGKRPPTQPLFLQVRYLLLMKSENYEDTSCQSFTTPSPYIDGPSVHH